MSFAKSPNPKFTIKAKFAKTKLNQLSYRVKQMKEQLLDLANAKFS